MWFLIVQILVIKYFVSAQALHLKLIFNFQIEDLFSVYRNDIVGLVLRQYM